MSNHTNPRQREKEKLTLWIVVASNGKPYERGRQYTPEGRLIYDIMTCVYARDKEHAETQVHAWFSKYPDHSYHNFQPCPNGFLMGARTYMPGDTTASQASLQAREDQVLTARLTAEKGHSTTHQYP